ncbi:MAG: beta-galactosidase [Phycisphaeraceae bacterium]|nr:beta-galactosidase [Phycisphaeraceae bacterium]
MNVHIGLPAALLVAVIHAIALGADSRTLFTEDFEAAGIIARYPQQSHDTAGRVIAVSPGQLSRTGLAADKPDACGYMLYRITVPIPAESRQHWIRVLADVKTDHLGPGASYCLMVTQLDEGKSNGENLFFSFDDGLTRQSEFGGASKSPQTLGIWKQTRHLMMPRQDTDQIVLSFVVNGMQRICIDNVVVEDLGTEKPAAATPMVFERLIDWPYAMLDLDNLLPGAVYRIETQISGPSDDGQGDIQGLTPNSRRSPYKAPTDMAGMGITMTAVGLDGDKSPPEQLTDTVINDHQRHYRLVVPPLAVKVLLDLHNDDLIRFDHNQIETQARRWRTVRIRLENYGQIASDNAECQYTYRHKPENLRPRTVRELTRFDIEAVKERLRSRDDAQLAVARHRNAMCFMLNGKPLAPMAVSLSPVTYDNINELGLRVFFVRTPYGGPTLHGDWIGDQQYDFSDLDHDMYDLLRQKPDAVILLSIDGLSPPDWWGQSHPDELLRDQDGNFAWCNGAFLYDIRYGAWENLINFNKAGSVGGTNMHNLRGAKWVGYFVPSTASRQYRRDVRDYLAALRRYVEQQPYGKAVAGYRLLNGYDGQWGGVGDAYGYDNEAVHCNDFSEPMKQSFRAWLTNKYATDEALRQAWNDPQAALASAEIPGPQARNIDQMSTGVYLLDPRKNRPVMDYRQFAAENNIELLVESCNAIKQSGNKPVITVAYAPDIVEVASGGGHGGRATSLLYASPDFDVAGGPTYDARDIGQPGRANCMLSSASLHDKLHMVEMDHRVFPTAKRNYANNLVFDSPAKTLSLFRREYMRQMCFGAGSWNWDMGLWYDDPLLARMIGQCYRVFSQVIDVDRAGNAEMAIFLGDYGKVVQADGRRGAIPKELATSPVLASSQAGLPIDQYLLDDLSLVAGRYKVFYFPFAYGLSPRDIQAINALKRDGNILVFGYGAGYISDTQSIDNMEKLTGIHFDIDPKLHLVVKVADTDHPLIRGMAGQYLGSSGDAMMETGLPRFYADDPQATTLATFADSDKAGIVVKKMDTWTSIYLGFVGTVPPSLERNIASFAGLHVYNDQDDVMFFNKSLVALHASSPGTKVIRLPRPAKVTSLWDDISIGRTDRIERTMQVGDNAMYLLEE